MPEQFQQVVPPQRDTARSRRKAFPGDMDEHGAAASGHPRTPVVIDFDDEIVEAVVPQKPIAWVIGRPPERMVIAPVRGVLAPGVVEPDPPYREQSSRARQAIGSPPQPDRAKPAGRCPAVTFALRRLDPGAAERNSGCNLAGEQRPLRASARPSVDVDEAK